ncbi:MAG: hypothetical protein HDR25_07520 [Lachnospiraceae bacterium]|nr:hypothetical protein [Lachnospiraceae bacterium]
MDLPWGATEDDFEKCKNIILELTENQEVNEYALNLLNIIYAKGGSYSEKTMRAFAEEYLKR